MPMRIASRSATIGPNSGTIADVMSSATVLDSSYLRPLAPLLRHKRFRGAWQKRGTRIYGQIGTARGLVMARKLMSIISAVTDVMQSEEIIDRSVSPMPASNDVPNPSGSPSPGISAGTMKASDWHILIVDDEPDIRKMLRDLLQFEGYTVSDAADGVFGLDVLRASPQPLIVLLDYKMPRMNGEELLQAVMADSQLAHRHAFIFVTANLPSFSPALHQLLADAAIAVIQKPFQIAVILDEIERAIIRLTASSGPPAP